jgi:hypothetical protein
MWVENEEEEEESQTQKLVLCWGVKRDKSVFYVWETNGDVDEALIFLCDGMKMSVNRERFLNFIPVGRRNIDAEETEKG